MFQVQPFYYFYLSFRLVVRRGYGRFQFTACKPTIYLLFVGLPRSGFPDRKSLFGLFALCFNDLRQLPGWRIEQRHQLRGRRAEQAQ